MDDLLNMDDFERAAERVLQAGVYGYYAGGANDEVTLRSNRQAFADLMLRYRVLVDVADRALSIDLLGIPMSSPIILAPTALHRMAHPDGERATARAATAAGILMTLSTISSTPMEEVAAAAPDGRRWFQLYHYEDKARSVELIARAVAAGYEAIVLTVDAPLLGRRERDIRIPFVIPDDVSAVHLGDIETRMQDTASPLNSFINQPSINWTDLAWIREAAGSLPLLLKGIVRADDAKRALDEGVAGLWVSNHGGRQLDTSIPTITALPEIADVVDGRAPIILDGGIRRGTDILKALALGADAVAIGRPQLWGLAVAGQEGVEQVVELLRAELSLAMALAGACTIADIDASLVG